MLNIVIGKDWVANRNFILQQIAQDVSEKKGNRILVVPELITHDMERRLCEVAGDSASRYCEVLSFTRLAQRLAESVGDSYNDYLDDGGRIVAMAASVRQMHTKLKSYASVETKPEFLCGLVDAIDEFKCCCIKPADIMFASRNTEGSLAQKLEEIAYIYEAYEAISSRGKKDPRDLASWVLDVLEECNFAEDHTVYVDGFPDFTQQNMNILGHFIQNSPNVTISLNCDKPGSSKVAFEKPGKTAQDIIRFAKESAVQTQTNVIEPIARELAPIVESIFEGDLSADCSSAPVTLFHTDTVHQECINVAQKIIELVQNGCRYRDIAVVCGDISSYKDVLQMVFERCRIPAYLSGTDELLEKNVILSIISAIDAALGSFDSKDIMQYLKSILSPLSIDTVDLIENYVFIWNITGQQWFKEWTNHPNGLQDVWSEEDRAKLKLLNDSKRKAIYPLEQLRTAFGSAQNVRQQVEAIYAFFTEINLAGTLSLLSDKFDETGDNRSAQILNQLWEILISSLEQMHSMLGEIVWDCDTFTQLFKLLLSQYDVGTIPTVLDSVSVGPVSAMRCNEVKHLFVVGAIEGCMPSYGKAVGVLSDTERKALRHLGVPVNDGSIVGLQAEFAEIYGVFCGARNSITVSYANGQPSFIFKRLANTFNEEVIDSQILGTALADEAEAAAFLAHYRSDEYAKNLGVAQIYTDIVNKTKHTLGEVSADGISEIYGNTLMLSASQVDRQAQCRLSYFLNYGLKVCEWKTAQIDPSEFGTYVHDVLENTVREIMERGGFRKVSSEEAAEIARGFSQQYAKSHFAQIDSERLQYMFNKNVAELDMIVYELWQEMQSCDFIPCEFELGFGAKDSDIPAIEIPSTSLFARLRGFVDRVDVLNTESETYYRVVDYKTGKKNFDYCDIYNGIGLQMLLYMFALEQESKTVFGKESIPAGVMYFPARSPYISVDNADTDEKIEKQRISDMKRKGLLLYDEKVIWAMESLEKPKRLPITKTKDGKISGDIATDKQFRLLKDYVFKTLGNLVDEIASGNVSPNPYLRGNGYGICSYCPYDQICHRINVTECRNYKAVPAQKFWQDIEGEVKGDG